MWRQYQDSAKTAKITKGKGGKTAEADNFEKYFWRADSDAKKPFSIEQKD